MKNIEVSEKRVWLEKKQKTVGAVACECLGEEVQRLGRLRPNSQGSRVSG